MSLTIPPLGAPVRRDIAAMFGRWLRLGEVVLRVSEDVCDGGRNGRWETEDDGSKEED